MADNVKVFIDGQYGTTGLQIHDRLAKHPKVEVLSVDAEQKKDPAVRKEFLNRADVVFLCLPDDASREAVSFIDNDSTVVIDASTAFRVDPDWVYGIPELAGQRDKLLASNRIANPGCYPTGMIMLVKPLIDAGILPSDYPLSVSAITGFSGGGNAMIADYHGLEGEQKASCAARLKNLDLNHKHLPEMQTLTGLDYPPVFVPTVADVEQGMLVSIPLQRRLLKGSDEEVWQCLDALYGDEAFVTLHALNDASFEESGFLAATACNGSNNIELFVYSSQNAIYLVARLDNLGKGASGAAVQNMNCRMGFDETLGLID